MLDLHNETEHLGVVGESGRPPVASFLCAANQELPAPGKREGEPAKRLASPKCHQAGHNPKPGRVSKR
ncbi:Ubiquitin Carboxyl-Terminal Hydrolase 27 [Manis pentadactyla]|nr:Ubiquitin Carboxyl-Terminal Hydrolase 27 [Manis pentadactyla]